MRHNDPEAVIRRAVKDWLANNRDVFELYVLATLWWDIQLFRKYQSLLCRNTVSAKNNQTEWTDDFSSPGFLPVYRAIAEYNIMWLNSAEGKAGGQFRPITPELMRTFLTTYAGMGEIIMEAEVEPAMGLFAQATHHAKPEIGQFVTQAISVWLLAQKSANIMRSSLAQRDAEVAMERLQQVKTALAPQTSKLRMSGFGHGIDNEELDIERIPTRVASLDIALGRGIGRQETTLIIAGQGVGKTIMACQSSSLMSLNRYKGLLISTEQSAAQLEPRIVSCHCNVLFDQVKDKVDPKSFHRDQLAEYEKLRDSLNGNNFNILDWTEDRQTNILDSMDAIITEAGSRMGAIDYVELDWLGGALGRTAGDAEAQRMMMKRGMDAIVELSGKYNFAAVVYAQAHVNLAYNRVRVDSSCLAECKSLGENATNVIGMTGLRKQENQVADMEADFEPQQYFYMAKTRKSAGGKVPWRRQFQFQRIASI